MNNLDCTTFVAEKIQSLRINLNLATLTASLHKIGKLIVVEFP